MTESVYGFCNDCKKAVELEHKMWYDLCSLCRKIVNLRPTLPNNPLQ